MKCLIYNVMSSFVINHAKKCADIIIVVIPMLSINDLKLMREIMNTLRNNQLQLIILHNLPVFLNETELNIYKEQLKNYFSNFEMVIKQIDNKEYFETNYNGNSIFHFFLGNLKKYEIKK